MKTLGVLIAIVMAFTASTAAADPARWRAMGWTTDFSVSEVDFDEIVSGGPPKDGIPAIDDPVFMPASRIDDIGPGEPVIQLELDGIARAYPLRVLTWHEIVNDVIGERPVIVTYCPLCNSAVVFDRRLEDGTAPTFGVSGLLRHSDMIMYDRATESWWQQFTGRAIVGQHAGAKLRMIPSRVVSFAEFAGAYPDGDVLVPNNPRLRPYGNNPYIGYDSREAPYPFYSGALPQGIDPMARIVVVRDGGKVIAVSLAHLREMGTLEHDGVTLTWTQGVNSALDAGRIGQGADVGAVRTERSADRADLVHDITFAFVVLAFHPDVAVLDTSGLISLTPR